MARRTSTAPMWRSIADLSAIFFPAQVGSAASALRVTPFGHGRRCMADAPGAKPAAPAAAAKPAAKSGGGGGKKKKSDDPASHLEYTQVKYGYGDKTRPDRQSVRESERSARLKSLVKSSSDPGSPTSPLAPMLAKLSGVVVQDDPILSALLVEETARQGLSRPIESPYGAERLGRAEEPRDLSVHALTERTLGVLGEELPEEFRGTLQAGEVEEEARINSDVESGDEAEKEYAKAYNRIVASQRNARPLLPSLPSQSAEDEARIEEMAQALLAGVNLQEKMAQTAKALGEQAGDMQVAASVAMRSVRDDKGRKLPAEVVAGLERSREHLVDRALGGLTGAAAASPTDRLAGETLLREYYDDDPSSEAYGTRMNGPWGSDPRTLPPGLLEDVLSPFGFTSDTKTIEVEEADTLRESLMTPHERSVNGQRKALRALIEAPQPIAYRPAWPLYAMIAGVDQVQLVVSGGMISSARCMVVVGNGMGGIGVGMVKHPDAASAAKKALGRAIRDMVHINTHKGALYHDLIGKKNGVYVIMRALPSSAEVFKAAPLVADVLELAGITRYSAKIVGSHRGRRNPYVVTQALFDSFQHHYPPEREAYLRGLRPVWATADRVTRHTVYPQTPKGPRFPAANYRFQDPKRARA